MTTELADCDFLRPSLRHRVTASPSKGRNSVVGSLLFVLALAGCDYFGYTPIKDIAAVPGQFEGKEVKIKGKVSSPVQVFSVRMFTLKDDTGEITVSTSGALPAPGTEVVLKGTVKRAVVIGGKSLGLRVEETQRLRYIPVSGKQ